MSAYSYCGLNIVSNIAIPELSQKYNEKAELWFTLQATVKQLPKLCWVHHWLSPSGEILLSYCREGSYHWLRFSGLADFRLSANTKKIACYPLPAVPKETILHLLLDQVLPRCLAHQGRIMLHGSAVSLQQGLILFIGDSGVGKSTMAGNFHLAGNLALSDDCMWLKMSEGQVVAVPSYSGLRLWEDSLDVLFPDKRVTQSMAHYSNKRRVSLSVGNTSLASMGVPVLAVMVLSPPDSSVSASEIILDRLSKREIFAAMLKQSFQLDLMDLKRIRRHMQALGDIVPTLPAYRLSMPRDYALLPVVRQKILETVL